VIVDADSAVEREWPEIRIELIRPVNAKVKKHCACHALNSSDVGFSNAVLVMSANGCFYHLLSVGKKVLITP
jgi:hypothetical protein